MKFSTLTCLLLLSCLLGCAGVNITPIASDEVAKLHQTDNKSTGYVVYEPMVVIEITQKEVCLKKDEKGNCTQSIVQSVAGTPFILPDYTKPYLVDVKSGFGKTGADITITDGWRLGNVKDNSDNTAALGIVEKLVGIKSSNLLPGSSPSSRLSGKPIIPGLYRVEFKNGVVSLIQLHLYVEN